MKHAGRWRTGGLGEGAEDNEVVASGYPGHAGGDLAELDVGLIHHHQHRKLQHSLQERVAALKQQPSQEHVAALKRSTQPLQERVAALKQQHSTRSCEG